MKIYFVYLLNTSRNAVTAWLDAHYRHCTVTHTYVMDNATRQHPLLYMDWYPSDSFEREWDAAALAALRDRLGAGFEQTTLTAYLSKAYGQPDDMQQFAAHVLATFAGVTEDADGPPAPRLPNTPNQPHNSGTMNGQGKVAIVTGGASGIGAAAVKEFAESGAAVAIFDINATAGQAAVAHYQTQKLQVDFFEVDVSDTKVCQQATQCVVAQHGRVDYLLNNAASFISRGLDATTEDWEKSLGVNVRGYANMVQAVFEPMKRSDRKQGGAIVNVASISSFIAQPNRWTYNACKGAIVTLTKCQALDLAPHGIRVNSVSPGWIWTPEVQKAAHNDRAKWEPIWGRFHMLRRLGEPREVARAILFLCSEDASFITGTNLCVDGGYMGMGSEGLGDTAEFAAQQ